MIALLVVIVIVLALGILGAIKLAAWVFLIALAIAAVAAYVGRSALSSR